MSKFIDKDYAKETIKLMLEVHQNFTWIEQEALKVALDALGEVCAEDCISRAEAIKKIESEDPEGWAVNRLEALPIVTPKVREGKWIYQDSRSSHWTDVYECSECKATYRITTYNLESELPDYCPNCGAKMREIEI